MSNVFFTHGSPRARQRLYRDDAAHAGGRSQTPTPPSTPGSRRSHVSLKDALGGGGARGAGETAAATSRAVGRARMDHARLGHTISMDGQAIDPALRHLDDNYLRADDQGSDRGSRPLSEFFDDPPDISIDGRLTTTEDGASTPVGGGERRYHTDQDSMDKCARWLQSLKMTSSDRLKSRSHIQLPPIWPTM